MSTDANGSTVVDFVKTIKNWLDALVRAGAVITQPDGGVDLIPDVRRAVTAMHAQLAGGDVKIMITDQGNEIFDQLEQEFDKARIEVSELARNQHDLGQIDPIVP